MFIQVYVVSNVRREVVDRKVVAHDAKGLKAVDGLVFVEMWKWEQQNPGKSPSPNMVDTCEVFQDDGSMKWEEGVWVREGQKGVHRFERYRDKQIRKEEIEDDGTCILSADQQEKKFDMAFKSLNVKAFTLDDIAAIPMDDVKEEEEEASEKDSNSSEADSDAAEKLESREYTGLFDRRKVVAGRTAAAKPKPAGKKGQTQPAGGAKVSTTVAKPKVSTPVASKRSETSAASSPLPTPPPPKHRRLSGKTPVAEEDDDDTQIGFVDGRAEKFQLSLNKSLDKLQPNVNDLKKILLLDNEEYLGSGDKFKKEIKILKATAKGLHTQCNNIVERIERSSQAKQLKTEKERKSA